MSSTFIPEVTIGGAIINIPRRVESYQYVRTMASGVSGVVVEVRHTQSGARFAAKFLKRPSANSDELRYIERELRLSMLLSCPYVVKCVDAIFMEDVICLIMEYCEGDLFDQCRDCIMSVRARWKMIFTHICLGIQYLHKRNLAHRDLKLENVLLDKEMNCKLADCGVIYETHVSSITASLCGTPGYMSPEIIRGGPYCAKKADIWSLGIMLYVAWNGRFPWKGTSDIAVANEIVKGYFDMDILPEEIREVVSKCCDPNPDTRPTIDDVMTMSFVQVQSARKTSTLPSLGIIPRPKESGSSQFIKNVGKLAANCTTRFIPRKFRNRRRSLCCDSGVQAIETFTGLGESSSLRKTPYD